MQRQPQRVGAVPDLQRREGVHVDVGRRHLHRLDDGEIGVAGVAGMDAALQADLGGAALPGLARARRDLVEVEIVGLVAVAEAVPALGEGAELAAVGADVGVVDVAVDDVGDGVADARARAARRPRGTRRRSPRRAPRTGATMSASASALPAPTRSRMRAIAACGQLPSPACGDMRPRQRLAFRPATSHPRGRAPPHPSAAAAACAAPRRSTHSHQERRRTSSPVGDRVDGCWCRASPWRSVRPPRGASAACGRGSETYSG